MTSPRLRRSAVAPRAAGLLGACALHAAVFALAAVTTTSAAAPSRPTADVDPPLAVSWTSTPAAETDEVVASTPSIDLATTPEARPLDAVIVDGSPSFDGPPTAPAISDAPVPPTQDAPRPDLRRAFTTRLSAPGRGGSGAGASSLGVRGSGGVVGTGVGAAAGLGGTGAGIGRGDGDGDADAAVAAPRRGGATRGPTIVRALSSPAYPPAARSRGWEGRVVLLLAIDATGRVTSVDVVESSGRPALDDAAREAAPAWTFAPALRDDAPVAGTLRVPVRFELTD